MMQNNSLLLNVTSFIVMFSFVGLLPVWFLRKRRCLAFCAGLLVSSYMLLCGVLSRHVTGVGQFVTGLTVVAALFSVLILGTDGQIRLWSERRVTPVAQRFLVYFTGMTLPIVLFWVLRSME
jgi:hypothetical protein